MNILRKFFLNFGVQSKLITLVLTASLLSFLLTGMLSFSVAQHLLSQAGIERLTTIRNARSEAIKDYVEQLSDQLMTLSETRMTIDAMKRFTAAFSQLPDINEVQKQRLATYYKTDFIPKLSKKILGEPRPATYYPVTAAERYLKYHHLPSVVGPNARQGVPNTSSTKSTMTEVDDSSPWADVHSEYQRRFARLVQLFDYQDIMMVDIRTGNVVYSVSKEDDFGTNLLTGPYSESAAAKVFREVKRSRDPFFVAFSDFEFYKPSFARPTMFVATTVFDGEDFIGALIFQLSNEHIDRLMTANRKWREVGMGESGETVLLGEDSIFRSSPRSFLENSDQYLKVARKHGLSERIIKEIQKTGTPVLVQPTKTQVAMNVLAGRSGSMHYIDYRGVPAVASYQPIRFGPFEWGLVAKIDQAELYSGIHHLARSMLLMAALLIPVVTFLTLWLTRAFIRPIRRLLDATEKISAGDYKIQIPVAADDEFGDLAKAFNTMSDKLGEREDSLKKQVEENDRLLRSILPGSAASRIKQGAEAMAESHPSVSVLFAEIEGWSELAQSRSAEESISLLNELTSTLDDCCARFDVEKLQNVGSSYLAVSGLSRPRIDHEKRAVDCALAMLQLMKRFNQAHNTDISLDIGVHGGPLTTGVVSGERLSFDIWGQTINIARGVHESPKCNVIQVTAPIVAALRGLYRFQPVPAIPVKGHGEIPIWEVEGVIEPLSDSDRDRSEPQEKSSR